MAKFCQTSSNCVFPKKLPPKILSLNQLLKLIADFNTYDQLPKVLAKNVNYEIML